MNDDTPLALLSSLGNFVALLGILAVDCLNSLYVSETLPLLESFVCRSASKLSSAFKFRDRVAVAQLDFLKFASSLEAIRLSRLRD